MKKRKGFWKNEVVAAGKTSWTKADDNLISVLKGESDCTGWIYPFYSVDGNGRYVIGFADGDEASEYSEKNGFTRLSFDQACFMSRKPNKFKNWRKTYPKEGLLQ